ncbi:hypothetical protein BKA66DRAFT_600104, partial [Pyrenochaeta sp. MPI-SDFR-AT-0127]
MRRNKSCRADLGREQKSRRPMILGPGRVIIAQSSDEANEELRLILKRPRHPSMFLIGVDVIISLRSLRFFSE